MGSGDGHFAGESWGRDRNWPCRAPSGDGVGRQVPAGAQIQQKEDAVSRRRLGLPEWEKDRHGRHLWWAQLPFQTVAWLALPETCPWACGSQDFQGSVEGRGGGLQAILRTPQPRQVSAGGSSFSLAKPPSNTCGALASGKGCHQCKTAPPGLTQCGGFAGTCLCQAREVLCCCPPSPRREEGSEGPRSSVPGAQVPAAVLSHAVV